MPGTIGVIRTNGAVGSLSGPLQRLCHLDGYFTDSIVLSQRIGLGQAWRSSRASSDDWYRADTDVCVLVNGHVLSGEELGKRLTAADVYEQYLRMGRLDPSGYEGAFTIVIVDVPRQETFICNDRLGTLPVYYYGDQEVFGFAPEVKALFPMVGINARLSTAGLISFLSAGYCLGDSTLFSRVKMLEPGCILTLRLDSLQYTTHRYWRLVFQPDPTLDNRRSAESELYDAIIRAHKLIVSPSEGDFDLLLSGGMDSRGNLAALAQIGRMPSRAFGWGVGTDIPLSDASLASQLAAEFNVPFHFIQYDTDQLLENADNWCYLSELANDNIGWFSEGASILAHDYDRDAAFTVVGDEGWGFRGVAASEFEAVNQVLPADFISPLGQSIRVSRSNELRHAYKNEIRKVLIECENDRWIDRKDFLYLHGRVARFIFSLGYYKELAVQLRRPFLANEVLKVVAALPAKHRIWKNLYLSVLSRYMPRTHVVPPASTNSLPDWQHDIRAIPSLREFFLHLLSKENVDDGKLAKVLDYSELSKLRDEYFAAVARPISRAPRRTSRVLERVPPVWQEVLRRTRRRLLTGQSIVVERSDVNFEFLKRVALVAMLQSQLARLSGK